MFKEAVSRNKFYLGPLEIRESTIKGAGYGVFATEDIGKNTLIERCNIIKFDRWLLKLYRDERLSRHLLADYIFKWPGGHEVALALGYGSMYNHGNEPNVLWRYCTPDTSLHDDGLHVYDSKLEALEFWTKKAVKSGEELVTNYGRTSEFGGSDDFIGDSDVIDRVGRGDGGLGDLFKR